MVIFGKGVANTDGEVLWITVKTNVIHGTRCKLIQTERKTQKVLKGELEGMAQQEKVMRDDCNRK